MNKIVLIVLLASAILFFDLNNCLGQENQKSNIWFIGYETLEMSMNNFQYFAGEIGYRIDTDNQLRLIIGEVNLTEEHLANKWQSMGVDGPNVNGYFRVYEINYDHFFGGSKNWYYGGNIGYKNDQYNYLLGPNKIDNHTLTLGFQLGYQKMNLFDYDHFYLNFSMPFRYYFHPIPEQKWGDTKILIHKFVNNIWFFVGYKF